MEFEELRSHWGIYHTPSSQALHRPVSEPPDIDMIGIWDTERMIEMMRDLFKTLPDPGLRCDYLDLLSEVQALREYMHWVYNAERAVFAGEDIEKSKFYEELINTLKADYVRVNREYLDLAEPLGESPVMDNAARHYGQN